MINYNNKIFRTVSNTPNGDVSDETQFYYKQEGNVVMATYSGGSIAVGSLIAIANETTGILDMRYHHITRKGSLRAGVCTSTPTILPDGRIQLQEEWTWTTGKKGKGSSIVEEFHNV